MVGLRVLPRFAIRLCVLLSVRSWVRFFANCLVAWWVVSRANYEKKLGSTLTREHINEHYARTNVMSAKSIQIAER